MGDGRVNLGGINPTKPNNGVHQDFSGGAAHTSDQGIAGTQHAQTYDNVTNVVQSKELPAGVIEIKGTFYGVASSVGIAIGLAIGEANVSAGTAAITAGTTPQILDGTSSDWDYKADSAVTRVDFRTMIAETGTNKFILEWKVAT